MATATHETESPTPGSPHPSIVHPLRKLRGTIRTYVTLEGLATVGLFLAVWFWFGLLLDYGSFKTFAFDWVQVAPFGLRAGILGVILAALLALVVTTVVVRLLRDFSHAALALVLERRFPKVLGDRLITAVELADPRKVRRYGYSPEMVQKTVDEVRERVDRLPLNNVFNWRRLRWQGILFAALSLGLLLVVGGLMAAVTRTSVGVAAGQFADVSAIWVERNVLLKNTPWPRQAHLELIDFPGEEKRIGRDNASPRIRVQAFKWVLADSGTPDGWRPLTWADLNKDLLGGTEVPKLPVEELRRAKLQTDVGGIVLSGLIAFNGITLPADVADLPDDMRAWKVDRVELLLNENAEFRTFVRNQNDSDLMAIENVFQALDARAAEPRMSRTLRKLAIPQEITLSYWGPKTSITMTLKQEPGNEYTGALSDLKESVKFRVTGADYTTPTKRITLVPAPTLTVLKRTEYQPAYLYHRPPFDGNRGPLFVAPEKMKGLKQVFADRHVSLTGDKSRFEVPMGTELVLGGTVDKPLKQVFILPKHGRFPGVETEEGATPIEVPVLGADRTGFELTFSAEKGTPIERLVEFELMFRDTDNVTSRRLVQIQPTEGRTPEVDVVVEVIRKVGGTYLCTPKAIIPFAKESRIRADNGLNAVEYVYSYVELEGSGLTSSRAAFATSLWLNTPQVPNLGAFATRAATLHTFGRDMRAATRGTEPQRVVLDGFRDQFLSDRSKILTLDKIKEQLDQPPQPDALIKNFDLKASGDEGFDIQKNVPNLASKDQNQQKSYLLTLNVAATDTNVETGPRVGLNKDPLVFKLVSEADLLAEISREQTDLALKLDDGIRRLKDANNKLGEIVLRLSALQAKDDYLPHITRSAEILETLAKCRDITSEVYTDFARIKREYETNRFPDKMTRDLDIRVVTPLEEILKNEFVRADEAQGTFHAAIGKQETVPGDVTGNARQRLQEVQAKLEAIRAGLGQVGSFQDVIIKARELLDAQTKVIGPGIKNIIAAAEEDQFVPKVLPPALLAVNAGQTVTVKVGIECPPLFTGKFVLKVEPSLGSEMKVSPAEIQLTEESTEAKFELTAGAKKGDFTILLLPDLDNRKEVAKRKELKVTVK